MASVTRWQRLSEWRRWRPFFSKNLSDTATSNGHGWTRTRKSFSTRKQEDSLHPSWVKSARLERTEMIPWKFEDLDMERATYFQGKGEEPQWHRERSMKGWCKVIRTSESAEDSRSVLELQENRSSIEGLLGKATAATESRTIGFSWKGKRCERQVRQRWRKERQVQRCWSTCSGSAHWWSSCELGGVVCTADGNKHNG